MVGKPGQPGSGTPTPGSGAAGAQANQAAQKGAVTGVAAWWKNLTAQSEPARERVSSAARGLQSKAKGLKFPSMPVDVKVSLLYMTVGTSIATLAVVGPFASSSTLVLLSRRAPLLAPALGPKLSFHTTSVLCAWMNLKSSASNRNSRTRFLSSLQVDILRPTMDAIRDSVNTFWVQLPPPVQQAAPYVGVAVGSGMLVFAIQQVRLNGQVGGQRLHG